MFNIEFLGNNWQRRNYLWNLAKVKQKKTLHAYSLASAKTNENREKVHYLLIGNNFKKVLKKLDKELKFYRFEFDGKFKGNEIIYDIDSNLLSTPFLYFTFFFKKNQMFNLLFNFSNKQYFLGNFRKPFIFCNFCKTWIDVCLWPTQSTCKKWNGSWKKCKIKKRSGYEKHW